MADLRMVWLNEMYPMSYNQARSKPTKLTNRQLFFDERCWTDKDIRVFFEDLAYGDIQTYELNRNKLTRVNLNSAEKRFMAWQKSNHGRSITYA